MTYTLVKLKVPAAFHRYVAEKLRDAEYHHAFLDGGAALDMNGIALVVDPEEKLPRCQTCRWWAKEETNGLCEVWRSERQKVWIDCGENTMQTAPDFGCVQWEEK